MRSTEDDGAPPAPGRLRRLAAWLELCALSACHTSSQQQASHAPAPAPASRAPAAPAPHLRAARTVDEYKRQIALRLVAANPQITYTTPAIDPLLAIPVLEIEVNADGGLRRVSVVRAPSQASDTVQIAIDAVRRAAPFGDPTHVPRPWTFTETFLFDEERRFKPRSLD